MSARMLELELIVSSQTITFDKSSNVYHALTFGTTTEASNATFRHCLSRDRYMYRTQTTLNGKHAPLFPFNFN